MAALKAVLSNKHFETIKQTSDQGFDYWSARDLMQILGYDEWRNFEKVIEKAIESCKNSGMKAKNQFVDSNKMVATGSGSFREIKDYLLTRYACYLIAQNGDSKKPEIAFAQTYFAIQTRISETSQENEAILERLIARKKLSETEKDFAKTLFGIGFDGKGLSTVKSMGDRALFGGSDTEKMKKKLGVNKKKPLADYLPTITIKAKDLAMEMTTFKAREKQSKNQNAVRNDHVEHNKGVRKALTDQGIYPENLPPEEDIKKLERQVEADERNFRLKQNPEV